MQFHKVKKVFKKLDHKMAIFGNTNDFTRSQKPAKIWYRVTDKSKSKLHLRFIVNKTYIYRLD